MFQVLEDNMPTMAPKLHRLLADRHAHLTSATTGVLILCDKYSGLHFLRHCLDKEGANYVFLDGKHEQVIWSRDGQPLPRRKASSKVSFGTQWNKRKTEFRTVVVDIAYLAEGINIPGIGLVLCCASFSDGSTMEQAFGRADRMCSLPESDNRLVRKLYLMEGGKEKETESALKQWVQKEKDESVLQDHSF